MKKKIIVIGSGVGGSASAALLAKAGHDVTLFEAHSFSGGRCSTMEREGYHYDFGVHMFSRGDKGPHGTINRMLGGNLSWVTRNPSCRVMGRTEFDFPLDIKPLFTRFQLARKLGTPVKKYLGAYRLFQALLSGNLNEADDSVCLSDYVSRYTDDDMLHVFVNCISQLYFALSYREVSAGEFIWSFSRMFNESSFGYPVGGGAAIPRSFLKGLERYGGNVRYNEPVRKFRIENGRVIGLETDSGFFEADVVISNIGLCRTIGIVGEDRFPEEYVNRAKRYRYSNPYIAIKYALDRPLIPYPVVFHMPDLPAEKVFEYIGKGSVPEDPYIFMPVPSNHDPGLAPPGKQLVIAGTAAPPRASKELCSAILDVVHRRVCDLFPGLENSILWQVRSSRSDAESLTWHPDGEAIGIGQFPDQVGALRPDHRTPISGLWLVGSDAGARGIGTEMAAGSALNLVEKIA